MMQMFWYILLALAVFYAHVNIKLIILRRKYKHFTALPLNISPWWFLGHWIYIRERVRPDNNIMQVFWNAHNEIKKSEHGATVFHLFNRNIILVMDLEVIGIVLNDHKNFLKSKDMHNIFSYVCGKRLFGPNGIVNDPGSNIWRTKRKMMDPAFHKNFLRTFMEDMNSIAGEIIDHLQDKKNCLSGGSFDISKDLCRVALALVCRCGFHLCLEENLVRNEDSIYIQSNNAVLSCIQNLFNYRFTYNLPWMFREEKKNVKGSIDYMRSKAKDHLKERMEREKNGLILKDDILSYIIKSNQWSDNFTLDNIIDDFIAFLGAGTETTGNSMGIILFFILKNPEVYSKLKQEVDTVFGDKDSIDFDDVNYLVYLEQTIKETLRLVPPSPSTGRQNMFMDQNICGTFIPKDAKILIPTFGLQRSEQYWKDPLKFNPDRFAPGQKIVPYTYMPFMAGPRSCIGKNFAMLEMKVILSRIIRNFNLIDPFPEIKELETIMRITTVPKNGVFIILEKRYF